MTDKARKARLLHYSRYPLQCVRSRQQRDESIKPFGLWVSVEGDQDWRQWCEEEAFELDALAVEHEVTLKPDANILTLSDSLDVREFGERYMTGRNRYCSYLDWSRVANEYSGIIIAPYQWSCRLDQETFWYYGWDCASGCIWDASAIQRFHMVATLPKEKP